MLCGYLTAGSKSNRDETTTESSEQAPIVIDMIHWIYQNEPAKRDQDRSLRVADWLSTEGEDVYENGMLNKPPGIATESALYDKGLPRRSIQACRR